MITFNRADFRDKVLGCWMGKNIGGTVGAPFEFKRQRNNITFYTQDLGGEPLANDDLDLQLIWLIALEEKGPKLDAHLLAEYWLAYITPHWSEYGICKANLRLGLPAPLCGSFHNRFKHSNGAWIRSEIWACITPGNPHLAAEYALQDAMVDHGDGEGTWAAVFCAALEAAAFVESDLRRLIDIALSYVPSDCAIRKAVLDTLDWHREGRDWAATRHAILKAHRGEKYFWATGILSPEEDADKFYEGILGWDAPANIALLVLALLYGQGDFAQTMCLAVNCGEDTDCTAATAGSILGIIHGFQQIPQKWIDPIGRRIKVGCLNLGELGLYGDQLPPDVDNLTDRTIRLMLRTQAEIPFRQAVELVEQKGAAADLESKLLLGDEAFRQTLVDRVKGPSFRFDFFEATVDYGEEGPFLCVGQAKKVRVVLKNTYKQQTPIEYRVYTQPALTLSGGSGAFISMNTFHGEVPVLSFVFRTEAPLPVHRAVIEFCAPGHATVMHLPILLVVSPTAPTGSMEKAVSWQ